nr:reverse transcriptase domain-containing protein [Tanacetum cinerariifolium]
MQTGSSLRLTRDQTSNPTSATNTTPKGRNRRSSKQKVKNSNLEEHLPPVVTMADNRTMAELLHVPTEGYAEEIVVPPILAEQFELKHSLINMMTTDQFFRLEMDNPHDHIRWGSPPMAKKEPPQLHQLDTFYNALNPADQDSLNAAACGNLLERINQQTSVVTTVMTAMLKQFQATPPPAPVKVVEEIYVTCGGAHPYYQCLAADGSTFPEFRDNIQGYVSAAVINYNQRNPGYRSQGVANQNRPPGFAQPNGQNNQNRFSPPQGFNRGNNSNHEQSYQATAQQNQNVHLNELEKIKRMNEANMKAMQTQIGMVKNKLRTEMKSSIQTSLSNQTNEIKNMMASLLQMNTASTSGLGSLLSNTVANPKGELKAITTRSGLVTDGTTVPTPPKSITPEVDERVEETYTDPDPAEYTIKVPSPLVQKYKPPSQREFVMHTRDPLHLNIPYSSRMLKQKQQEKDEVQIQNFWQMFEQLHINITLADALVLMPKYQKMLKALLSNKEKHQELANTPLNENYSAVILKKLPEKLGDPGKFLIPCGFSKLKCKALADLGASINLMPLSVWKELGLPELIPTRMTLKLANRVIYTPAGIARDVFVPVGKFTFSADFVIVNYESDPIVPFILGRPFLRTARALIDVHDEEMILCDGDERLTLNMKHDTSSYSNQPQRESVNLINIFNVSSEDFLEFDIESDLKEIEFLLYQDKDSSLKDSIDQKGLANLDAIFVYPIPEMFTDDHTLDYSSPPKFDVYDDFSEVESDAENVYDDLFDSKGEKIKESKLLIDELDLPYDFLPPFEYDSFISSGFFRVDALPSTNNEDKAIKAKAVILNHRKSGAN